MADTATGSTHPTFLQAVRRALPCVCLVALLIVCLVPDHSHDVGPDTAEFIFFDVGQGDASLIRTEAGCVLIDAGTNLSEDRLSAELKRLGIERIDCLLLTHAHEDHIGGADRMLRDFDVKTVIARDTEGIDAASRAVWNAVRSCGAEVVKPKGITTYAVGGLILDVIVPFGEVQSDGNDSSLVVRVSYGDTAVLYMGDAEAATEKTLLTQLTDGNFLRCDGLKLGHHGSDSSSCTEFLHAVSPHYAVASAGAGNSFGHPHGRVLSDLSEIGCICLRTDLNGTVTLISDGESLICRQ